MGDQFEQLRLRGVEHIDVGCVLICVLVAIEYARGPPETLAPPPRASSAPAVQFESVRCHSRPPERFPKACLSTANLCQQTAHVAGDFVTTAQPGEPSRIHASAHLSYIVNTISDLAPRHEMPVSSGNRVGPRRMVGTLRYPWAMISGRASNGKFQAMSTRPAWSCDTGGTSAKILSSSRSLLSASLICVCSARTRPLCPKSSRGSDASAQRISPEPSVRTRILGSPACSPYQASGHEFATGQ